MKYRQELIQMKRALAELRSTEPKDGAPVSDETWIERLGEKVGDFLAEPSASQILTCVLLVLLVFALALALTLG